MVPWPGGCEIEPDVSPSHRPTDPHQHGHGVTSEGDLCTRTHEAPGSGWGRRLAPEELPTEDPGAASLERKGLCGALGVLPYPDRRCVHALLGRRTAAVTMQVAEESTRWGQGTRQGRRRLRTRRRKECLPTSQGSKPRRMLCRPIGLRLQNTDSRIKLLRISRGQLRSIKPSVDPLSMGLYDHMGQRPMKLVLPRAQLSSTFVLL